MSLANIKNDTGHFFGRCLAGIYMRAFLWYLLGLSLLWYIGVEGSYGNPLPFYAVIFPAFRSPIIPGAVLLIGGAFYVLHSRIAYGERKRFLTALLVFLALSLMLALLGEARINGMSLAATFGHDWLALRWHFLVVGLFAVSAISLVVVLKRLDWFRRELSPRARRWMLAGLVAFAFSFPGAVAMLRDGTHGISQAYERHGYEYISDIGTARSIQALCHDYLKLRPYLSLHARVHPPGPIIVLWLMSYAVGQEPLPLSLATMFLGALAIIPLFLWVRDMTNSRVALTCCFLYCLMPSIVLFTATSADITFTPITISALFFFWRAVHKKSAVSALVAGTLYAVASLLTYSLLTLGAFFALIGLWRFIDRRYRFAVIQTAVLMLFAFLGVHFAVRWWSGFDYVLCYHACKEQFEQDQAHLDLMQPRFPGWAWRLLNPVCWFYFAGIPASLLFIWRLAKPDPDTKALFLACAGTAAVMTLLYLGRGEGERSAMYIFPFVAVPAAHMLDQLGRWTRSLSPLIATLVFMACQCWFTESYFYTFW